MALRKKKGYRVTHADFDKLAEALHQCTFINLSEDEDEEDPVLDSFSSTQDEVDDVDANIQFFCDEMDDAAALHSLDWFAFEHELAGPVEEDNRPVFLTKPHCWWP